VSSASDLRVTTRIGSRQHLCFENQLLEKLFAFLPSKALAAHQTLARQRSEAFAPTRGRKVRPNGCHDYICFHLRLPNLPIRQVQVQQVHFLILLSFSVRTPQVGFYRDYYTANINLCGTVDGTTEFAPVPVYSMTETHHFGRLSDNIITMLDLRGAPTQHAKVLVTKDEYSSSAPYEISIPVLYKPTEPTLLDGADYLSTLIVFRGSWDQVNGVSQAVGQAVGSRASTGFLLDQIYGKLK